MRHSQMMTDDENQRKLVTINEQSGRKLVRNDVSLRYSERRHGDHPCGNEAGWKGEGVHGDTR